MKNFTRIDNALKPMFFDNPDLGYGDLAVFTYIAMHVQISDDAGKGSSNGKQGYAYTTKTRMQAELSMSKKKLNDTIDRLIAYGLIDTREVPNKYGGRPLTEYRLSDAWKGSEFIRNMT